MSPSIRSSWGWFYRWRAAISFRQAGIFRDATLIEIPLACIGYVAVVLLNQSPLAVLFVLAPIALIYQAFMLPKLQAEAIVALESVNQDLTVANQSIRQLNDELFLTLAKVFDARDPYVGGHAAQVSTYAVAVAHELGLPAERLEVIRQSGICMTSARSPFPNRFCTSLRNSAGLSMSFSRNTAKSAQTSLPPVTACVTWRPLSGIITNAGMGEAIRSDSPAKRFRSKRGS